MIEVSAMSSRDSASNRSFCIGCTQDLEVCKCMWSAIRDIQIKIKKFEIENIGDIKNAQLQEMKRLNRLNENLVEVANDVETLDERLTEILAVVHHQKIVRESYQSECNVDLARLSERVLFLEKNTVAKSKWEPEHKPKEPHNPSRQHLEKTLAEKNQRIKELEMANHNLNVNAAELRQQIRKLRGETEDNRNAYYPNPGCYI